MVTKAPGWELKGLSTDDKPLDAPNGSVFIAVDTGDVYMFDATGGKWYKLRG